MTDTATTPGCPFDLRGAAERFDSYIKSCRSETGNRNEGHGDLQRFQDYLHVLLDEIQRFPPAMNLLRARGTLFERECQFIRDHVETLLQCLDGLGLTNRFRSVLFPQNVDGEFDELAINFPAWRADIYDIQSCLSQASHILAASGRQECQKQTEAVWQRLNRVRLFDPDETADGFRMLWLLTEDRKYWMEMLLFQAEPDEDPVRVEGIDAGTIHGSKVGFNNCVTVQRSVSELIKRLSAPNSGIPQGSLQVGGGDKDAPSRPALHRDHLWLQWKLKNGMGPAKIRDMWNAMGEQERRTVCPTCWQRIEHKAGGREVVKKGILLAEREAKKF